MMESDIVITRREWPDCKAPDEHHPCKQRIWRGIHSSGMEK